MPGIEEWRMKRAGSFDPGRGGVNDNDVYHNSFAASFAKYVRMISAPARLIPVSISIITRCSSIQPRCEAAFTILDNGVYLKHTSDAEGLTEEKILKLITRIVFYNEVFSEKLN